MVKQEKESTGGFWRVQDFRETVQGLLRQAEWTYFVFGLWTIQDIWAIFYFQEISDAILLNEMEFFVLFLYSASDTDKTRLWKQV